MPTTATPKIGFALSHEQFPSPQLVDLAVAAEDAGFDCVWASDHFQPWMDNQGHAGHAWVTLAAISQRVSIPFGTGVTCPIYRYEPAIVAQAFATLAQLAPGRVFLGTGTGEALNEHPVTGLWGRWQERADRLEEAITVIRELWTGEIVDHDGPYFAVRKAKLYDTPPGPIPIYVSATGPKSAVLAGRSGDGLVSSAESTVDPAIRAPWRAGLEAAGRSEADQQILAELQVVVGGDEDARAAAEMWRFQPKAWDVYVNDPNPRSIVERARRDVPIEQLTKKMVIGIDARPHVEKLVELFRAGVTQVYVHSGQPDQQRVIEFYGRQVIPAVKAGLKAGARAA